MCHQLSFLQSGMKFVCNVGFATLNKSNYFKGWSQNEIY